MMVLAIKVQNVHKMNLSQFVIYGLNKFRQASHTQDYEPAAIEVSPAERAKLPPKFSINNIPVVASKELEPGYLRVVTEDIEGLED